MLRKHGVLGRIVLHGVRCAIRSACEVETRARQKRDAEGGQKERKLLPSGRETLAPRAPREESRTGRKALPVDGVDKVT